MASKKNPSTEPCPYCAEITPDGAIALFHKAMLRYEQKFLAMQNEIISLKKENQSLKRNSLGK